MVGAAKRKSFIVGQEVRCNEAGTMLVLNQHWETGRFAQSSKVKVMHCVFHIINYYITLLHSDVLGKK